MADWEQYLGRCFWFENGSEGHHLHVVTAYCEDDQSFLLLHFSSMKDGYIGYDGTHICEPGCHPSITRKSFVYFCYAKTLTLQELEELVRQRRIAFQPDKFPEEEMARLRTSTKLAKELPRKFKNKYS